MAGKMQKPRDYRRYFFMNPTIEKAAAAYAAPKIVKGFRLSWVLYGVAAYYGLKYMNKRGILPKQTDFALGLIDRGINFAKDQVGSRLGLDIGSAAHTHEHARGQQASLAH
jgi:hypothetical protein